MMSQKKIQVWDAPVRVFHWLLVLCFVGAHLSAESERWALVHITLGYTMAALIVFRLVWGLMGTRHARFGSFVRGPAVILGYLRGLLQSRQAPAYPGHNPAGAVAIVLLLVLSAVVTLSGWLGEQGWGGHWAQELHEAVAEGMWLLVLAHVAAVLLSSWWHRENLVGAMFTGRKPGAPDQAIRRSWSWLALLLLAAVLLFWWWQWRGAPAFG